MAWSDVSPTSWSGFAVGDPLQAAIAQALQQRPQPQAQEDPWAPDQPSSRPSLDNPRDAPDWLSSGGGSHGNAQRSATDTQRGADLQSGGIAARDISLQSMRDMFGLGQSVTTAPAVTAAKTLIGDALGMDIGGFGTVSGAQSQAQLDAKARAIGFDSFADAVAQNERMGMPNSVARAKATESIAGTRLGLGGNAAIGRATNDAGGNVTAARDKAYGPGFGPGPGASTAASSRSRSPAPGGGSVGAALGSSRF